VGLAGEVELVLECVAALRVGEQGISPLQVNGGGGGSGGGGGGGGGDGDD
jgi:hypothetical protein